ncbi:hypothetical protein E2986_12218 [Frieseomelitta varia]|uniref:Uncharacterized protein n=1 Tax=Frieseomelitta varia TaxID=561572 RepID=A0A833S9M2_9HYME|nr:hypothetical protein E2986_12218 [Frieseomelitta varia]
MQYILLKRGAFQMCCIYISGTNDTKLTFNVAREISCMEMKISCPLSCSDN